MILMVKMIYGIAYLISQNSNFSKIKENNFYLNKIKKD
jgi:hypothetical protein